MKNKRNKKNQTPSKPAVGNRPPEKPPSAQSRADRAEGERRQPPSRHTPVKDGSHEQSEERSVRSLILETPRGRGPGSDRNSRSSDADLRMNLNEFAEDTHLQYDTLADELARAQAKQDRLNRELEEIRARQAARRSDFVRKAETMHEKIANAFGDERSSRGRVNDDSASRARAHYRARAPEDDGVTYADPDEVIERGQNDLFRARDDDETSTAYKNRINAQTRFLAQEHYRQGAEKRNAQAERWWQERVRNAGGGVQGEPPRQSKRHHGGQDPPSGGSSSSSSRSSSPSRDGRRPSHAHTPRGPSSSRGPSQSSRGHHP